MNAPFRVLTLTDDLAPNAGRAFVGLGADVVRVVPAAESATPAAVAARLHWYAGQQTLVAPDDATLDDLVADVDLVVESGPVASLRGVVTRGDGIRSRWPAVPHVVVTPFGLTGPHRDRTADDLVAASAGGMTWLGGRPETPPKPPPRDPAVQLAGAHAATAGLLAVLAHTRTGVAQLVEVSVQEAVAATLETAAIAWIAAGRFPRRNGGVYEHVAHRVFATADGHAAGGWSGSDRMWTGLRDWLAEVDEAEDLLDPAYDDGVHRWEQRPHLDDVVARFAARRTTVALAEEARARALPWAEVVPASALVDNPQLVAREFPLAVTRPDGTVVRDVGFAFASPHRPRPVALQEAVEVDEPVWSGPRPRRRLRSWADRYATPGRVLDGLRVLDLTWVLAGPYATKQLAEHGADVVKVESMHRQDPTRFSPGMRLRPGATHDDGAYFVNFNRGKRSIAVNMRTPRGVELVQRLARECDVVIENFAPGVLARWGLDHASLQADNPDVIVVSMSGVGQTGPWRRAVTFADTLAAMSGLTAETADPGGPPQGLTFGLGDMVAANAAVLAVLERLLTATPGPVDLSQLEAMATTMGTAAVDAALGVERASGATARRPTRVPDRCPHGVYPVAGDDRWVAVSTPDDAAWRRLADAVPGLAPWADLDLAGRKAREDDIDAALDAWTTGQDGGEVAARLQALGTAAAVVATGRDLVEGDGHLRARGFYPVLRHPLAGEVVHEGIVARLTATPGALHAPAPLLGEHTDDVLHEYLALPDDEIADLRADAVLG